MNNKSKRVKKSVDHHPLRVCIKVPNLDEVEERKFYDELNKLDSSTSRFKWVEHVLGDDGVYVGRPKNDGGWFQVPIVKQGSFLANPYSLKDYSLDDCLNLYTQYIKARMEDDCTIEKLIGLLPKNESVLAEKYYITHKGKEKGKSTKHYELNCFGKEFVKRLESLEGKRLGCFCDYSSRCHVDVILNIIQNL